jgi:hypothetical protein
MKRIIVAVIVAFALFTVNAIAAEQVMTVKPDSVSVLKTKTGESYVRILVSEQKEASGIKFSQATTFNAYRDLVGPASKIKPGTEVTMVVEKREYQGRTYYTILGIKSAVASK